LVVDFSPVLMRVSKLRLSLSRRLADFTHEAILTKAI